jgi:hypothetical protein
MKPHLAGFFVVRPSTSSSVETGKSKMARAFFQIVCES